jgi:anaphase-promoting complex subunit 10
MLQNGIESELDEYDFKAEFHSVDFVDPSRSLNNQAIFSVSSARIGNDVNNLLSDSNDEYWQSDGISPHIITVRFLSRQPVDGIQFYLSPSRDESYSAKSIQIYFGNVSWDLNSSHIIELSKSEEGYIIIQFVHPKTSAPVAIRCSYMEIHILDMWSNGRDCRIRRLEILKPATMETVAAQAIVSSNISAKSWMPPIIRM